jgi:hypothetical protein
MEEISRSNLVVNKMGLFQRHVSAAFGCTYARISMSYLFHRV